MIFFPSDTQKLQSIDDVRNLNEKKFLEKNKKVFDSKNTNDNKLKRKISQ